MIEIIISALKINPFNANFTYLHSNQFSECNLISGLKYFSFNCFIKKNSRDIPPDLNFSTKEDAVLFYVKSKNQFDAIKPIWENWSNGLLIGSYNHPSIINISFLRKDYLFSLLFLPALLYQYLLLEKAERIFFKTHFNEKILLSYGFYFRMRKLLRKISPKILLVANDHLMELRMICKAAQDEKIKTIYIQHASVSERFPPLTFDYAFLDGMDALEKYDRKGSEKCNVFLTGNPKYDKYIPKAKKIQNIEVIGICFNLLDPKDKIINLIISLKLYAPQYQYIIRPHPGMKDLMFWENLSSEYNCSFSNPKTDISYIFLEKLDLLVAGDSNILLEAALMNVSALTYDFANQEKDNYGFVKKQMVEYCNEPCELIDIIKVLGLSVPNIRDKTKFFVDTVKTKYDGKSTKLVILLLDMIINNRNTDDMIWDQVKTNHINQACQLIPYSNNVTL